MTGESPAPRAARSVADQLRRRIIDGDLQDGDRLPKQDQLLSDFGVSQPTLREALGVLEAEGLVVVRRGRVGGVVVRRPRVENAAYVLELVLQAGKVSSQDIGQALRQLEPICAGLCAAREDRNETVVPVLRSLQDEAEANLDDVPRFTELLRNFHEQLVESCGNHTMILILGALEKIWSSRATVWLDEQIKEGAYPDREYRLRALSDHELMIRLIERGDARAAAREASEHLAITPVYGIDSNGEGELGMLGAVDPGFHLGR